jgi:hypothetical protein
MTPSLAISHHRLITTDVSPLTRGTNNQPTIIKKRGKQKWGEARTEKGEEMGFACLRGDLKRM